MKILRLISSLISAAGKASKPRRIGLVEQLETRSVLSAIGPFDLPLKSEAENVSLDIGFSQLALTRLVGSPIPGVAYRATAADDGESALRSLHQPSIGSRELSNEVVDASNLPDMNDSARAALQQMGIPFRSDIPLPPLFQNSRPDRLTESLRPLLSEGEDSSNSRDPSLAALGSGFGPPRFPGMDFMPWRSADGLSSPRFEPSPDGRALFFAGLFGGRGQPSPFFENQKLRESFSDQPSQLRAATGASMSVDLIDEMMSAAASDYAEGAGNIGSDFNYSRGQRQTNRPLNFDATRNAADDLVDENAGKELDVASLSQIDSDDVTAGTATTVHPSHDARRKTSGSTLSAKGRFDAQFYSTPQLIFRDLVLRPDTQMALAGLGQEIGNRDVALTEDGFVEFLVEDLGGKLGTISESQSSATFEFDGRQLSLQAKMERDLTLETRDDERHVLGASANHVATGPPVVSPENAVAIATN